MAAVVIERALNPVSQRGARRPIGKRAKLPVVSDEIADIDLLALGRELPDLIAPAATGGDQRGGERGKAVGRVAADIKRLACRGRRDRGGEKRLGSVLDKDHVAALLAAPALERFIRERPA